jgi:hypothetical protein
MGAHARRAAGVAMVRILEGGPGSKRSKVKQGVRVHTCLCVLKILDLGILALGPELCGLGFRV